jgi:hypothetical protein
MNYPLFPNGRKHQVVGMTANFIGVVMGFSVRVSVGSENVSSTSILFCAAESLGRRVVTRPPRWGFGRKHRMAIVRLVVGCGDGLIREVIGGLTASSGE